MSEEHVRIFQDGDAVLLRGNIVGFDDDDGTYRVQVILGVDSDGDPSTEEVWSSQDGLTWAQDAPIAPGDFVRPRSSKQVGQVMGVRKGHAWVDWSPFVDEQTGFTTSRLDVIVQAEPELIEEARERAA